MEVTSTLAVGVTNKYRSPIFPQNREKSVHAIAQPHVLRYTQFWYYWVSLLTAEEHGDLNSGDVRLKSDSVIHLLTHLGSVVSHIPSHFPVRFPHFLKSYE